MSAPGPGLAPDEKLCPFCAEVIKAAAIKCRYCQSELPLVSEPITEPVTEAVTEPVTDPAAEPQADAEAPEAMDVPVTSEPPAPPPRRRPDPVVVGLAALCALLVAGLVAIFAVGPSALRTAGNGQVTATSYRSAAMSAAASNAAAILSYTYKTLDANEKAAHAVTTGKARKAYDDAMEQAAPKATGAKLSLKANVLSTSLISLTEHRASVLLFYDAVATAEGSQQQQLNQNRVKMTMTRQDGDWIVSDMEAF